MDLWNYYEVDPPYMTGMEEDWQHFYRDCWNLQVLRRSRSLTDLLASAIHKENKRVEYILYRMQRYDAQEKVRIGLSKKPKLFKELVQH